MLFFERQQPQPQHPALENNGGENNDAAPNGFDLGKWFMDLATDLRDVLHASCLLTRSILRVLERLLSGIIYLTKYQLGCQYRHKR